ncbi:MAG: molybdenum cofactor guanylyltransferase, partial [Candidatus Omnitrophica bacterium]|nr:molybdenum cofactor guanylyltransferase [Candidatus Omnitrophota bacterium]
MIDIAGAVLAGGQNKRMGGRNKAFLEIEGVPLIQSTLNIFKELFEEIIIVTNNPEDYTPYEKDCRIVGDILKGFGPLSGIHAALSATSREAVFFVACDMPFLHNEFIKQQILCFNKEGGDALVPRIGESIEPLHAICKKKLTDEISFFLKTSGNYSIREFLKTVSTTYMDLENGFFNKSMFKNLNTPE